MPTEVERKDGDELVGLGREADAIRPLLDGIVFQKSPSLRSLLIYLWRHRGEDFSEYAVGTEAIGRKPDFDPKTDSTVRVHISRLRQKLKEYYETEGRDALVRVSIPLGGHALLVESHTQREAPQQKADIMGGNKLVRCLGFACLVLSVICVVLLVQNRRQAGDALHRKSAAALPRLWQSFFSNNKPASLFLPNPVFFEWPDIYVKVRDVRVNDFSAFGNSPELAALARKWGKPKLMQNYNSAADTYAAMKLSQYFQSFGISLALGATSEMSIESLREHNTILIGTPGSARRYLAKLMQDFEFTPPNNNQVINHHPRAGEPAVFQNTNESSTRHTEPGIIDFVSGRNGGPHLLIFVSNHTSSVASLLVSASTLALLEDNWGKAGHPSAFEAVVMVETEGRTVLRGWPVAFRSIPPNDWEKAVTAP